MSAHISLAKAFAADAPATDTCATTFQAVIDAAPKKDTWANGVLDHLHRELYRFNSIETADIELIFCRLINVMGMNPDLTALPQTISKTDPLGSTVTATITAPTETFAKTNGYTAKAELKNDDTVFLTVWWAGSGTSSKGYLIQGANPMHSDGNTRLRYAMWDRTGTTQVVKLMAAQFASSYLKTPAGSGTTGGDNAIYGRLSYDTSTNAISSHAVEIRQGNSTATASVFKCVRSSFSGILNGTVGGYRPAKGTPEDVTETSTGGESLIGGGGMDGETALTDATTTADHSGTASPGSAVASGTFEYSCNDINNEGSTGGVFAGNTVSFTAEPSTIFPK